MIMENLVIEFDTIYELKRIIKNMEKYLTRDIGILCDDCPGYYVKMKTYQLKMDNNNCNILFLDSRA